MKPSRGRWLVRVVQAAAIALVLLFLARYVIVLWPDIAALEWHISPSLLACALVAGLGCQALLVLGWRLAIGLVGADIPWNGAVVSQVFGQLAKYVPGKVLTLIGKAYLAAQAGVPESRAVLAMFVEAGAQVATALAVGSIYIVVVLPSQREFLPLATLVVLGCCALLHPALLPRAISAILARLGREAPPFEYRLAAVAPLAACYVAFWCLSGIGVWLLGLGLGLQIPLVALTAAYAVSWAAGFLSIIFPGGLGVREYALALVLVPAADPEAGMTIALASRAWILAVELGLACAVWAYQTTRSTHARHIGARGD